MLTFAGRRLFWADARTFFPSSLGRSYQLKPGQPWYLRSCPTYSAWFGKIKKAVLFLSLKSRSRDFPQIFPSNVHAYPQKTKRIWHNLRYPIECITRRNISIRGSGHGIQLLQLVGYIMLYIVIYIYS